MCHDSARRGQTPSQQASGSTIPDWIAGAPASNDSAGAW
jgi:hypothetical protein